MSAFPFTDTWIDLQLHAGEAFYRLGGASFTYAIDGEILKVSETGQGIGRESVERACAGGRPQTVSELKQAGLPAPSHLFAILTDPRIRV